MAEEMSLFEVMYNCRAMRRLDTREVEEEKLRQLIEAANQAPSGSNMQSARWIIARDSEVKQKLADLNRKGVEVYLGNQIQNPGSLPHQDKDKRGRMVDAVVWQMEHMHEIPALIIACMDFGVEVTPAMRAGGNGSIWPGIQNLLLAAPQSSREENYELLCRSGPGERLLVVPHLVSDVGLALIAFVRIAFLDDLQKAVHDLLDQFLVCRALALRNRQHRVVRVCLLGHS